MIEIIYAYVMIRMHPGRFDEAISEMQGISGVEKISVVAGKYDIIVRVAVSDLEELHILSDNIQQTVGVKKTTTHIIEKEITQ